MNQKYQNSLERRVVRDFAVFPFIAPFSLFNTKDSSTTLVGDEDI